MSGESRQLRDLQREVLTIQNNVLLCTNSDPSPTSLPYVITISSHMICDCGREMIEEELFATWTAEHKNKKKFRLNVHEFSQDIDMAHKVLCVGCNTLITPSLTVTCYTVDKANTAPGSSGINENGLFKCRTLVLRPTFQARAAPSTIWGRDRGRAYFARAFVLHCTGVFNSILRLWPLRASEKPCQSVGRTRTRTLIHLVHDQWLAPYSLGAG